MPLLPELTELMAIHALDAVKITVTPNGCVKVFTLSETLAYPLTLAGYQVWVYEGAEFLANANDGLNEA